MTAPFEQHFFALFTRIMTGFCGNIAEQKMTADTLVGSRKCAF